MGYNNNPHQIMLDWYKKGEDSYNTGNEFESFIYLWISWVVACKIHLGNNRHINSIVQKDIDDRKIIVDWCKQNSEKTIELIVLNINTLGALKNRFGSYFNNPIVDASSILQEKFKNLQGYLNGNYEYIDDKDLAADLAELLNKVRNNLFHGGKSYDNREDMMLIKSILPIMKDLTQFAVEEFH